MEKNHIKIAQLAYDTTLVLKYKEMQTALNVVKEFGTKIKQGNKRPMGLNALTWITLLK